MKVPWKVPPYRAFKMMNGLSCNNVLLHDFDPAFLHNFRSLKKAKSFLLKYTDEEIDFSTINVITQKVRRED